MMSLDSKKCLEAMKFEMGSMYENKVWTLVDLPDDRQAIKNKWIFKKKTDADDQVTTEPRRSTRVRSAPEWYGNPTLEVMLLDHDKPTNYEEAMMSPDSKKCLEAMKFEMGSMYENKVWTLVDLPDDRQAIKNKWIFKKKTDADGNVTVYKAQLVTKGFRQVQGVDYDETFSPVAMLKSV
nr:Retrovirus-related Pol polyprotein from transposon TNT 1-94 [Triticum aestivum]